MSRRLLIEADGGSRGNPGPAGYGAVVVDHDTGEVLAERAQGLGRATNNVAEYRGLIAGLTAAVELSQLVPISALTVQMDSKLVVEQMAGRWKVKHPDMIPLSRTAAELVRSLALPVRFSWIPRAQNAHADRLANEAMDAQALGQAWQGETAAALPLPSQSILRRDAEPHVEPEPQGGRTSAGWSTAGSIATTTILLRHGQTALSAQKRFSGRGDPPLTTLGEEQAAQAARRLARLFEDTEPTVIVSSPLARARQTAAAAAAALHGAVVVDERLIEADFGDWEGMTFAEVRARQPDDLAEWLASPDVAPPGGESFTAVGARVEELRNDWLSSHPGRLIVGVSHVSPIKSLARLALDAGPSVFYRTHLDLCGISTIDWYADGPASLRGWNALT